MNNHVHSALQSIEKETQKKQNKERTIKPSGAIDMMVP